MKKNKIIKLFLNSKFLVFFIAVSVLSNIVLLLKLNVFKNFNLDINNYRKEKGKKAKKIRNESFATIEKK